MKKLILLFLVAGSVVVQAGNSGCCGQASVERQTTKQPAKPVAKGGWWERTEDKVETWGREAKEDTVSAWDKFKAWWNNPVPNQK